MNSAPAKAMMEKYSHPGALPAEPDGARLPTRPAFSPPIEGSRSPSGTSGSAGAAPPTHGPQACWQSRTLCPRGRARVTGPQRCAPPTHTCTYALLPSCPGGPTICGCQQHPKSTQAADPCLITPDQCLPRTRPTDLALQPASLMLRPLSRPGPSLLPPPARPLAENCAPTHWSPVAFLPTGPSASRASSVCHFVVSSEPLLLPTYPPHSSRLRGLPWTLCPHGRWSVLRC